MIKVMRYKQTAEKHLKVIKQLTEKLEEAYATIYPRGNNEWEYEDKAKDKSHFKKLIKSTNKYIKENQDN